MRPWMGLVFAVVLIALSEGAQAGAPPSSPPCGANPADNIERARDLLARNNPAADHAALICLAEAVAADERRAPLVRHVNRSVAEKSVPLTRKNSAE